METSIQAMCTSGNVLAAAITTRPRAFSRGQRRPSRAVTVALAAPVSTTPMYGVSFASISAPWTPSLVHRLKHKPWSLLFEPTSTPQWLAIGTSSETPLSLYTLDQDGLPLSDTSPRILGSVDPTSLLDDDDVDKSPQPRRRTSVYALCTPHALSTTLNPRSTLIAGYFDSTTRVYDLRSRHGPAGQSHSGGGGGGATEAGEGSGAKAVMTFRDPLSDDPSYSVTSSGPHGAYVLTGSARHGAVRIWDVRNAAATAVATQAAGSGDGVGTGLDHSPVVGGESRRHDEGVGAVGSSGSGSVRHSDRGYFGGRGRTMFSPGHDPSPVYSLVGEYSRVWGATDRRAFVLDFDDADGHSSHNGGSARDGARTTGAWAGEGAVKDVSAGLGRSRSGSDRGRKLGRGHEGDGYARLMKRDVSWYEHGGVHAGQLRVGSV
jgi:WD40 repeat protein